nr:hypothetical protein [uncultured Methanoregula sp.]
MTLTRSDLAEFRRREKETGALTLPPANFLRDLKILMDTAKAEAGTHPAEWSEYAEIHAIMDLVEDIFRIRRSKLARAAEENRPGESTPPEFKTLLPFESNAWYGLTATYHHLDKVLRDIRITGEQIGKWGDP